MNIYDPIAIALGLPQTIDISEYPKIEDITRIERLRADPWNKGRTDLGGYTISEEHKNNIRKATLRTIENGTHNLIGMNQIRIKNGTHNFLGGDATKKQYAEGKHPANNIVTCPHCGRSGAYFNMKRYHFDLCKFKPTS